MLQRFALQKELKKHEDINNWQSDIQEHIFPKLTTKKRRNKKRRIKIWIY